MLFFRSEELIEQWCSERELPRRPVIRLDQLWELATTWYWNRLTPAARRPSLEEIPGIFDRIGLSGPFWEL